LGFCQLEKDFGIWLSQNPNEQRFYPPIFANYRELCISQEKPEHPCFPVTRPPQSKFRKSRWQGLFALYLMITNYRELILN
jgi:hypothetical protein